MHIEEAEGPILGIKCLGTTLTECKASLAALSTVKVMVFRRLIPRMVSDLFIQRKAKREPMTRHTTTMVLSRGIDRANYQKISASIEPTLRRTLSVT